MCQQKVEAVEQEDRQTIVPLQSLHDAINHTANQESGDCQSPQSTKNPHVAILVVGMRFCVSRRRPSQSSVEKTILDGRQICVRLDDHDILDI